MNKVLIFTLGAVTGGLLTWKIVESKYKKLADDEIASVVEHYKNKEKKELNIAEHYDEVDKLNKLARSCIEADEFDNVKIEYTHRITDLGYADDDATVILEPTENRIAPYVISPDEYGETQYYDTKSWTYYSDFVLADDDGEIINDPEDIVGDALAHFGEFEDDAVHVRNENTECDYEILKVEKTFSEVYGEDI